MAKSKKTNEDQQPKINASAFVFIINFGLEPSERQRKALAERANAWSTSVLNGWIQDGKTPDGSPLSTRDYAPARSGWVPRTARGRQADQLAKAHGQEVADEYAKAHQPPIAIECDGREGHSDIAMVRAGLVKVSAAHWSAIEQHRSEAIKSAIKAGRILGPEDAEALLRTKDQAILESLIAVTQCADGLAHLLSREKARTNPRKRVLDACKAQGERLAAAAEKREAARKAS